jgi:hypothetical protein
MTEKIHLMKENLKKNRKTLKTTTFSNVFAAGVFDLPRHEMRDICRLGDF